MPEVEKSYLYATGRHFSTSSNNLNTGNHAARLLASLKKRARKKKTNTPKPPKTLESPLLTFITFPKRGEGERSGQGEGTGPRPASLPPAAPRWSPAKGEKAGGSRQPLPPGSPRPGRAPQPLPPRPRLPVPGLPAPTHAYGQRPGPHDRPAAGPAPAARPERAPAFPDPRRPPQGGRLGSTGTARPAGPARPAACGGSGACPLPLLREPPGGLCEEGEWGDLPHQGSPGSWRTRGRPRGWPRRTPTPHPGITATPGSCRLVPSGKRGRPACVRAWARSEPPGRRREQPRQNPLPAK